MNTTVLISVLAALAAIAALATRVVELKLALQKKKMEASTPAPSIPHSQAIQTRPLFFRILLICNALLSLGSIACLFWLAAGPQSKDPLSVGMAAFIGILCIQIVTPYLTKRSEN